MPKHFSKKEKNTSLFQEIFTMNLAIYLKVIYVFPKHTKILTGIDFIFYSSFATSKLFAG